MDRSDPGHLRTERVFLIHEEALRHAPDDRQLQRRCRDRRGSLGDTFDAAQMIARLLERLQAERPGSSAAEQAELEDLLGRCELGASRKERAEGWFVRLSGTIPIGSSATIGWRGCAGANSRQEKAADDTIREMVARNPKSGRAYFYRWRHRQEFAPPADSSDLQVGAGTGPRGPGGAARRGGRERGEKDTAAARAYLEKGLRLAPDKPSFALRLARLELREGDTARAEAVLKARVSPAPLPRPGIRAGRHPDPPGQDRRGRAGRTPPSPGSGRRV